MNQIAWLKGILKEINESSDSFWCRNGHIGCSNRDGGLCMDEELSTRGLNNDGEPIPNNQ